jgi:serine/threonine protein kinase
MLLPMNNPPDREVTVFNAALQLPAGQRAAYLDAACAGENALRLKIEALLRVHDEVGTFLENPTQEAGPSAAEKPGPSGTIRISAPPIEQTGERIGRYKLLQQIGEGGCGVVYMAEQEEPVRRKVALKVIKLGMDTKHVIARFEAERQALALMDHPNIAKVLDAGATDTGRPFFVMELVRGIKITDYCDENNLATKERLKLFTQVCQAIQHAHQKGIIHRDIKPSNILVANHDGVPVPKVIDFGIAKATTDQRLTDKTLFTALEQFIGTPAYMSPEQARLSGLDIDTRTDIYSLGVLLYELLTGKTPFDAKELLAAGLEEMRRTIREQEPPRPSTALSTMMDADLTTVARHRQSDAPQLIHLVRGELDWIVMKCLEKDRARRYESANGLAMDIRHHLADETVSAGAPTAVYRFNKFVRRNKKSLGIGTVLAILTIAILVSILLLFQEFKAGKYGGITIGSHPEGAEVWHGGHRLGITPFNLTNLPPGEFTYRLLLKDYESVTNTTPLVPKLRMNDFVFLQRTGPAGAGTAANLRTNLTELIAMVSQGVSILTTQGKVEIARRGTPGWAQAHANMVMSAGDQLRTGLRSRAMLLWSDNSLMRISELTSLEISSPPTNTLEMPSLKINNGNIYRFDSSGTTNDFRIYTPVGTAGIGD